jgi:acyl carrier protein
MIEQAVKDLVCSVLKLPPEQYSEDLAAGDVPAWDSLGHVNLLMAVEKHFGIALEVVDSIEIETAGDILDVVRRYKHLN